MSAQPITAPLIPAVIPSGVGVGSTTLTILVNPYSGVHHCADCDYVAESFFVVRRHRADAHGKGAGRKKGTKNRKPIATADRLADVVLLLTSIREDLTATAEKSLRSLRRILGTAVGGDAS